jgi:hypothetical protein
MIEEYLDRIATALERIATHIESVTVATTRPATVKETDEVEDEKSAKKKAAAAKRKAAVAAKNKAATEAEAKDPVDDDAGEDGPGIEDLRAKVKRGIVLNLKPEIKDLFSKFDCGSVTTMDEAKYSDFEVELDALIEIAEAQAKDDE